MSMLAQWNMIGHQFFDSEPIANIFYLQVAIFEFPKYRFIKKPPTFRIISIWSNLELLWNYFSNMCAQRLTPNTAQKMKFSIKDFFSKCDQIRSFLRIWSHLLKKSLKENFIFCAVQVYHFSISLFGLSNTKLFNYNSHSTQIFKTCSGTLWYMLEVVC